MKMHLFFLALAVMVCLCGCTWLQGGRTPQTPEAPLTDPVEAGKPLDLASFSFTHLGMSTDACFLYSAVSDADGVRIQTEELVSGGDVMDVVLDEPVLRQLGEIVGKYRMDTWDGFDKDNRQVSDGSRFSLSMTLQDGTTVSAQGNNAFPDGYAEAKGAICALFEDLIERHGSRYPKTLASDDLDYISISLRRRGEDGDAHLDLTAYAAADGGAELRLWAEGYADVFPGGDLNFDGEVSSFPFADVQKIVRTYDIPSWNGWDKTVDGLYEEWIQMTLGYTSEESIEVMGSRLPDNYDAFRTALLEIIGRYAEENRQQLRP